MTRNAQQRVLGADVVMIETLRFGRGRFQYVRRQLLGTECYSPVSLSDDAVLPRFFPFKLGSVKPYSRLIFFSRAQNLGWERRVAKRKRPLDTGDPAGAFFISSLQI